MTVNTQNHEDGTQDLFDLFLKELINILICSQGAHSLVEKNRHKYLATI